MGDAAALGDVLDGNPTIDAALADWEAHRLPCGRRLVERGREMDENYLY